MKRTLMVIFCIALGGCETAGKTWTYSPMPGTGSMTTTRLKMAQGVCKMRWNSQVDASLNTGNLPVGLGEDAQACFASQGINLAFVPSASGKFPAAPK